MAERRVAITGMTCAACEQTVADAALAAGATAAVARSRSGTLVISGDDLPSEGALAAALAGTPYGLGARRWLTTDRRVWRDVAIAAIVVGLGAAALTASGAAQAVTSVTQRATGGSLLFIVLLGVTASVSTCMALVGGLVISLTASAPAHAPLRPHLMFNAGRVVGFAAFGAVVGAAGHAVAPSGSGLAIGMLAVAVVMALLGVRLTGLSPRLAAWQLSLPASWGGWARSANPDGRAAFARPALLGAATFFLPCGFTQAVQVMALTSGSAFRGALLMGAFAVGTAPGLLVAAKASSAARGAKAAPLLRAIGVLVLAFALVTASGAARTLFPGLGTAAVAATERTSNVVDVNGVQRATVQVVTAGYSPASTVVYVGEPVEWVLDPTIVSCAGLVDARSLGVGNFDAVNASASVTFTIDSPGTYAYNCRMGMYSGTITAIERPAERP